MHLFFCEKMYICGKNLRIMSREKLIFVTNDDGYNAKGIEVLTRIAREFGRVVVVATQAAQSGNSHAITMYSLTTHSTHPKHPACHTSSLTLVPVASFQLDLDQPSSARSCSSIL